MRALENQEEKTYDTKAKQELPNIVKTGLFLGCISLLLSIGVVIFPIFNLTVGGGSDILIIFAIPVFAIFILSIVINAIAIKSLHKKEKGPSYKKTIATSITGLILSLLFIIAIPISISIENARIAEYYERIEIEQKAEEMAKITYETTPTFIEQIMSYSRCFSYEDNTEYRSARDAICGYLRYTYSNNWQEPATGEQLIESGYVPNYFWQLLVYDSSMGESYKPIKISNESNKIEISRSSVNKSYLITPHQSCSQEKNDSLISVWYIDDNSFNQEEQEFVCMYYDYHKDALSAKLNQYENTSLNIYSDEFKDFYEELLRKLYRLSQDNADYEFSVPYQTEHSGVFLYDNASFINNFFSAWPNGYFD